MFDQTQLVLASGKPVQQKKMSSTLRGLKISPRLDVAEPGLQQEPEGGVERPVGDAVPEEVEEDVDADMFAEHQRLQRLRQVKSPSTCRK